MRTYLVSLGAGVLVGMLYGVLNVRSPAPPVVALVGLLGILLGEQAVPVVRSVWLAGTGGPAAHGTEQPAAPAPRDPPDPA